VTNKPANIKKLYFAAPLFSSAELQFNLKITNKLENYFQVYLPQRDGKLMSNITHYDIDYANASSLVFSKDINELDSCDLVLAILDGRTIDEGVAFEIGYAYARGKTCIGLQTDSRRLAAWGNNPMISGALKYIFYNEADLFSWINNNSIQTTLMNEQTEQS